jgi:hypothetical protein
VSEIVLKVLFFEECSSKSCSNKSIGC